MIAINMKRKPSLYLAYILPSITSSWLIAPLGVLQGIYAKYFGLSLSTIATVILCARLFDAVSDPLVGFYSDRFYSLHKTRKPIIFGGGLLFIVSSYFLYVPVSIDGTSDYGSGYSEVVSPFYFASWFILFYLSSTLFEIPHITWAGDLATDAKNKAKIYSYRGVAGYLGMIFFFAVPMLPFFEITEITPDTLKVSVISANTLMLIFLVICLRNVPDSLQESTVCSIAKKGSESSVGLKMTVRVRQAGIKLQNILHSILANKPFFIFLSGFILISLGIGMWYGLLFIYVDAYLGVGDLFAPTFVLAFSIGVVSIPGWCAIAIRYDKSITLCAAIGLIISGFIITGFFEKEAASGASLLLLQLLVGVGFACVIAMAPAMVSEAADYGAWKSHENRPASYFAIYNFSHKTSSAVSTAVGLSIAGWYGFDVSAGEQTSQGVVGIKLTTAYLPAFFASLSLIFIYFTPINARRHRIIRRRLESSGF